MRILSIDIETKSATDLIECGVYRYVEDPTFEILWFSYAWDLGTVITIDLTREYLPREVFDALFDPTVLKTAFNAQFERICIQAYYGRHLPRTQWRCTMVYGAMLGLPMKLEQVADALGLEIKKDKLGKELIQLFSVKQKVTKQQPKEWILPSDAPEKWIQYGQYNNTDVVVEINILKALQPFRITAFERSLYHLDQKINDTGMCVDLTLARNAIDMDRVYKEKKLCEVIARTGIDNPASHDQVKAWLFEQTGDKVKSLNKKAMPEILKNAATPLVKQLLDDRSELTKTSVKKYYKMFEWVCADGRMRGMIQHYGAGRTGRWAGRGLQPHNLPKSSIEDAADLDLAHSLAFNGDAARLETLYGSIPHILSDLIRTALVASPGRVLQVVDFSAIEARVIAWFAGEQWRLNVFKTHGKIYEASVSAMFRIPLDKITKTERGTGKVCELALGFGGAVGALLTAGALEKGLKENELPKLVKMWRNASPKIVQLWYDMERAALDALENNSRVPVHHGVAFAMERGVLFMELPSGRRLAYFKPEIGIGKFGQPCITYLGMNQKTKQWKRVDTYGGKLVENAVQAIARDTLAEAMVRVDAAGFNIVLHVHDEIVCDTRIGTKTLHELESLTTVVPTWARGLPIAAEAFESTYYKK